MAAPDIATRTLSPETKGPLKGVRVLDMTSVIFGAYATQILGDLGADVIKVEFPEAGRGGGDVMRWAGDQPEGAPPGMGPIFLTINRNKRSVLLDVRKPSDAQALHALIASCEVFATSVRMDGLKRLGLDYAAVQAIRPDVIYAHGAGYGAGGANEGAPAYDDLIQAASGAADLIPRADGDPTPRYLPTVLADKVSGLFMTQAILAALFHHQRTGEGQFVEVPMMECVTSFTLAEHLFGHAYDPPTGGYGYHRVATRSRRPHPTKDGWIGLLPYTEAQWRGFFDLAGWSDTVARDARFADPADRARNIEQLYDLLSTVTPTRTTAEWLAALKPLHIPAAKVNRLDDLMSDPHLASVGLFERYEHPQAGAYVAMRSPLRFSATPAGHPPPSADAGGAHGRGAGGVGTRLRPPVPLMPAPLKFRSSPRKRERGSGERMACSRVESASRGGSHG